MNEDRKTLTNLPAVRAILRGSALAATLAVASSANAAAPTPEIAVEPGIELRIERLRERVAELEAGVTPEANAPTAPTSNDAGWYSWYSWYNTGQRSWNSWHNRY